MLALICFAVLSTAQAVTPPPDGGYPGGNTAEGTNALPNANTAIGINNTAVGANALRANTVGGYNVAIGEAALADNLTGSQNTAIGTEALRNNNAIWNVAVGFRALFMNTSGSPSEVTWTAVQGTTYRIRLYKNTRTSAFNLLWTL